MLVVLAAYGLLGKDLRRNPTWWLVVAVGLAIGLVIANKRRPGIQHRAAEIKRQRDERRRA